MICVEPSTLREILQLLREIKHPKAPKLAKKLLKDVIEQQRRDIDFDDGNVPVLCRRQAT